MWFYRKDRRRMDIACIVLSLSVIDCMIVSINQLRRNVHCASAPILASGDRRRGLLHA